MIDTHQRLTSVFACVCDFIVSFLIFVWWLLITHLVFWVLALQAFQQHCYLWLSITDCGWYFPSDVVVHQSSVGHNIHIKQMLPDKFHLPLRIALFLALVHILHTNRIACLDLVLTMQQHDSNKTPVFLHFSLINTMCSRSLLHTGQGYANFCFRPTVFGRNLQMEDTSNRNPEHFDLTLNAMKLRCIKI